MHMTESSQGCLVHFPGKTVLSRQEAVRYLGISRMAFITLRALRCGPSPRLLDGRSVYREEELEHFKTSLLLTVGVSPTDTPYQPVALPPVPKPPLHIGTGFTPQEETRLDPLMQLLAGAAIRHRVVLLMLWGMIFVGGLCTLILF